MAALASHFAAISASLLPRSIHFTLNLYDYDAKSGFMLIKELKGKF
jgi:hypothetical protein